MSDDRRKPGSMGPTDAEIEAMAKVVAELLGFAHQHNLRRGTTADPRPPPGRLSGWPTQIEQPT
jgi:hypothetical protein